MHVFLTQAIGPAMKREFPSLSVDPMKFFVARVKSNLHILMCLQPMNNLLKLSARYSIQPLVDKSFPFISKFVECE